MPKTRLTPSSGFTQELTSIPGGDVIEKCLACGVCSASCTISANSQINPRQIIQKILVGARDSVVASEQPWICKACHLCESRCQYGVNLYDVFAVVRKFAVKEGVVHVAFQKASQKILTDGWLLKHAYSDFVADERKELGLGSRLTWNKRYTKRVRSEYFGEGG
ncbi:MAG: 4Fe-4S dicluster domain-containing protein [Promethearchaeota archaeon]